MASLKDMRVRIAATKATQKITKAMQMVAASKLRRAQAAAEAARPYAEHRDNVLRSIAASVAGLDPAPPLLRGLQHRIRLADAGSGADEDLEARTALALRRLEERIRRRPPVLL